MMKRLAPCLRAVFLVARETIPRFGAWSCQRTPHPTPHPQDKHGSPTFRPAAPRRGSLLLSPYDGFTQKRNVHFLSFSLLFSFFFFLGGGDVVCSPLPEPRSGATFHPSSRGAEWGSRPGVGGQAGAVLPPQARADGLRALSRVPPGHGASERLPATVPGRPGGTVPTTFSETLPRPRPLLAPPRECPAAFSAADAM